MNRACVQAIYFYKGHLRRQAGVEAGVAATTHTSPHEALTARAIQSPIAKQEYAAPQAFLPIGKHNSLELHLFTAEKKSIWNSF